MVSAVIGRLNPEGATGFGGAPSAGCPTLGRRHGVHGGAAMLSTQPWKLAASRDDRRRWRRTALGRWSTNSSPRASRSSWLHEGRRTGWPHRGGSDSRQRWSHSSAGASSQSGWRWSPGLTRPNAWWPSSRVPGCSCTASSPDDRRVHAGGGPRWAVPMVAAIINTAFGVTLLVGRGGTIRATTIVLGLLAVVEGAFEIGVALLRGRAAGHGHPGRRGRDSTRDQSAHDTPTSQRGGGDQ